MSVDRKFLHFFTFSIVSWTQVRKTPVRTSQEQVSVIALVRQQRCAGDVRFLSKLPRAHSDAPGQLPGVWSDEHPRTPDYTVRRDPSHSSVSCQVPARTGVKSKPQHTKVTS